jgi:hypothetical protein
MNMNVTLIIFAIQLIAVLVAVIREMGEDEAFAGDKLGYRS